MPRFEIKNTKDKEFLKFIRKVFNSAVRHESENGEEG